MSGRDRRKSDRVDLAIPIEVSGFSADGQQFWEPTFTLRLNRHGGSILVSHSLAPDQELTIRKLRTGEETEVRVVGKIGQLPSGIVYGVVLLHPEENFWGIEFPPIAEAEQATSRVLLECSRCHTQEVVYMNETETDVFEVSRTLPRTCRRCGDSTVWKESTGEATLREPREPTRPQVALPKIAPAPVTATVVPGGAGIEKRQHKRIRVNMQVCVRKHGEPDDVADCTDVSKGGICFESDRAYEPGETVEVATHYRPGAPAIFIPARIARVQRTDGGRYRCGVSYLTDLESQLER